MIYESSNNLNIKNSAYYHTIFYTNNAERMRITNTGNVGIGTTSPAEKLHVAADVRVDGSGGVAVKKIRSSYFSSSQNLDLEAGSSADIILTSSNVGIGTTSPSAKLELAGTYGNTKLDGHFIGFTRAAGNYIWASAVGGDLRFTVNGNAIGSPSMIINTSGNVGIGTTSPSQKLHISGNMRLTVMRDTHLFCSTTYVSEKSYRF